MNRIGQRIPVRSYGAIRLGWFRTLKVEIRDVSPGGARLALPEGVILPDEFVIKMPQFRHPRTCLKRWESGREAGVEFRPL